MIWTRIRRMNPLALALAALLSFACVGGALHEATQQGWWAERGPVVPHRTFPASCDLCHVGDDWTTVREDFEFDHAAETGYALEGAHEGAQCLRCHNDRGPAESFAARGCAGCHGDVHEGLQGSECATCHTQTDWRVRGAIAAHDRTRFPLVGAHAATACRRCHEGIEAGILAPLDVECVSCHRADLARAEAPDHIANGWVETCDRCHIPTGWTGAAFNHNTFPLNGAHRTADCTECHVGGVFAGTPSACFACHQSEYQSASDPDHVAAGFSTDCAECHNTSTWEGANFAHNVFRLTGAHFTADCTECHVGGVFVGTPSDCFACHQSEYQSASDPDHVAGGFPMDCQQCHGTSSWEGATFGHKAFPLTGAHAVTDCAQCHAGGVYAGTPSDCFSCHQADYQAALDPNHAALGFPRQCEQCHGTTTWSGATFNHKFQINGGPHGNLGCADCHVMPGNLQVASCTHCHEHRQSETDDEHDDVPGYVYSNPACIACHPDGRE